MISRLRIGPRLLSLVSVQIAVSAIVGLMAILALDFAGNTTSDLSRRVASQARLSTLSQGLQSELLGPVYAISLGGSAWDEARRNLERARTDFEIDWRDYLAGLTADEVEFATDVFGPHLEKVPHASQQLDPILAAEERAGLERFVAGELGELVGPFLDAVVASSTLERLEAEEALVASQSTRSQALIAGLTVVLVGVALALGLGLLVYRSIKLPVARIAATVSAMSGGDFQARTGLSGEDELKQLGSAFDEMLNERMATLDKVEQENQQLNESVIRLLQAVAELSRRDLTVRVPVTEDVTGPVADSLNLLTSETAKVLQGVREVSGEVARASNQVKQQSDAVIGVAATERREVEITAKQLVEAADTMIRIAKLAHASGTAAERAIATTRTAMATVTETVSGIKSIRDTIRQTEKRIKRLGERSQEISGVVKIINSIAERTHILALNASMHAASTGEAGRGFAVVADEVQRLAENAREATSQIATLVNNIQVETSDTVATMNETIAQVVAGSELAEAAGQQMRDTNAGTSELVELVRKIAIGSRKQAQASIKLSRRAQSIRQSTQHTSEHLRAQSKHTELLVHHAGSLLEAVSVFTLPEPEQTEPAFDTTATVTEMIPPPRALAVNE